MWCYRPQYDIASRESIRNEKCLYIHRIVHLWQTLTIRQRQLGNTQRERRMENKIDGMCEFLSYKTQKSTIIPSVCFVCWFQRIFPIAILLRYVTVSLQSTNRNFFRIFISIFTAFHLPLVHYVNRMHSTKMKNVQIAKYLSGSGSVWVSECLSVCGAENSRSH